LSQSQEANNEEVVQAMPQSLTKKQRKLQAKQKAKELADAVAEKEGHDKTPKKAKDVTKKSTPISLSKDRRLRSGVVVNDLIIGNGPGVKPGRQVSILYEGSFPNSDKVFDKNQNKNHPLTFRIGTGEVIRGLEHGIEGMKVGGERTITIPPELAYGKKGSGNTIPKNATLVFSVQLLSTGSKA
jgi:FKBP-type peptidyl-prolyl cis-trans isomerase